VRVEDIIPVGLYNGPNRGRPKKLTNASDQTELASNFTVKDYETARNAQEGDKIAEALRRRFTERYLDPATPAKGKRMHGFTMMAISCLMIESLQSFCEGWKDSKGCSEKAFTTFFDSHSSFKCFRGQAFWQNVRNGILHQAETTGGWMITRRRSAPLFDSNTLTINATVFLNVSEVYSKNFAMNLKLKHGIPMSGRKSASSLKRSAITARHSHDI
jgi:hypothetical protein